MQHPNTAHCLSRLLVVAEDPELQACNLARAAGARLGPAESVDIGGTSVAFTSTKRLFDLYGGSVRLEGILPRVVGISIRLHSLSALKATLDTRWTGKLIEADPHRMIVPAAECFGVMLEFIQTDIGAT
jgi:hypothetical protein